MFSVGDSSSSFFSLHTESLSSLKCKACCIAFNSLFLWSIILSSSLLYLKNGSEYLTKGITRVFIPLMRFSAAEVGFEKFSSDVHIFYLFGMTYISIPNSIPISWLHILILCKMGFLFFFSFGKYFYVIYILKVVDLFLWLCKTITSSAILWLDLVSFFQVISNLGGLSNAKAILVEKQQWYSYLT